MPKLVMCKGLPGSGKSTWAQKQELKEGSNTVRVNKDDIRRSLGEPWSRKQEARILDMRDYLITIALCKGKDVISDDTNFAQKHEQRLRSLAKKHGASFVVKVFDTPLLECLRRDAGRSGSDRVGEKVIMEMYNQYLNPCPSPIQSGETALTAKYIPHTSLPPAIICDLDGTLAIHNGRSPYDFQKCDTDVVNGPVYHILWSMKHEFEEHGDEFTVIYLSGRDDVVMEKTRKWLEDNDCPPGPLYMRKTGDKRNDTIVKGALFDAHVRDNYNVLFCLDDRDRVVKLWRDIGLCCLQVNYGAF